MHRRNARQLGHANVQFNAPPWNDSQEPWHIELIQLDLSTQICTLSTWDTAKHFDKDLLYKKKEVGI